MPQISHVAVIGAGTMGHGIAQVVAAAGLEVKLHDISVERIEAGFAAIRANLEKGLQKGKVTADERDDVLSRVHSATDLALAVERSELVIEAAPERIDLKRRIFGELDRAAPATAILASNTSSLSITKIAEATCRPDRVVGLHFFNPVHIMPLLEIVRAELTDPGVVRIATDFGRRLGKEPIVVRDSPGFASSRLGLVLGLEAMRMVEQGVATAEDIDKAMTLGYRHPMGPLRLTDLVGLDVRLAIAEHLYRELGSEAFRPPEILRSMVAGGHLGKKTGRGFHQW